MKLNQYHSLFEPWYKSLVISLLTLLCFPLLGYATNIDSLKYVLKTSNNQQTNCSILFEIYQHYGTIDQVDSMNLYARIILKKCTAGETELLSNVRRSLKEQ